MFEEIENKKKHSLAFTILTVFVLLATIAGVAVAAYTWSFTSSQASTIGTGSISMTLLESTDTISITNALPVKEATGISLSTDQAFDFAVTTNASGAPGDISYNISITKVAVDSGYTALNDSDIMIYLTTFEETDGDETPVVSPTLVSSIITSGDTGTLTFDSGKTSYLTHTHATANSTQTTKYRLRMWIDEKVDASDWTKDTKNQYKLKIGTSGTLSA
ncbi:MAG: hypothetical protein ACI31R_01530 [Bacilli bacterium]